MASAEDAIRAPQRSFRDRPSPACLRPPALSGLPVETFFPVPAARIPLVINSGSAARGGLREIFSNESVDIYPVTRTNQHRDDLSIVHGEPYRVIVRPRS